MNLIQVQVQNLQSVHQAHVGVNGSRLVLSDVEMPNQMYKENSVFGKCSIVKYLWVCIGETKVIPPSSILHENITL